MPKPLIERTHESLPGELKRVSTLNPGLSIRVIAVLLLGLIANLLTPWPFKFILDEVLPKGSLFGFTVGGGLKSHSQLYLILALTFVSFLLIVARGFFNHLRHRFLTQLTNEAGDRLRLDIFGHLLAAEVSGLGRYSADDLRSRVNDDINQIKECIVEVFASLAGELLTLVITFAILFYVEPSFAILTTSFFACLFVVYKKFPARIEVINKEARSSESERNTFVGEILRHHLLVKAWVRESVELRRLSSFNTQHSDAVLLRARGEGRLILTVEVLTALMTASILGYGGWSIASGRLTIGGLVLFMQYLAFLYTPIGRMSGFLLIYQKAQIGWRRIQEITRFPLEAGGIKHSEKMLAAPVIRIRGLQFSYSGGSPLFANFDAEFNRNEITALVGPSGIGKSTLFRLLMGFEAFANGEILINGQRSVDLSPIDIRRQIAYVDQEATLFTGTVRENLVYGPEPVNEIKFRRVCRALEIDAFVLNLPQGYDTLLREGAILFSTGQRQRLAIARALISERPIVLMDEPTSALDPALEERLLPELSKLLSGRTAILITHRQLPLRIAHKIVSLKSPSENSTHFALSLGSQPVCERQI